MVPTPTIKSCNDICIFPFESWCQKYSNSHQKLFEKHDRVTLIDYSLLAEASFLWFPPAEYQGKEAFASWEEFTCTREETEFACNYAASKNIRLAISSNPDLSDTSQSSDQLSFNQLQKCCDTPTKKRPFLHQIALGHRSVRYNVHLPPPSNAKLFLQVLSMVLHC